MDERVDILVVGAGLVGLLTAVELTLGDVLVLERLAAVSTVMKAMGVGVLGIEALERRGMAAAIAAAEARDFAGMPSGSPRRLGRTCSRRSTAATSPACR